MPVLFRRGCDACHADSPPLLDAYHEEMHRLLDLAGNLPDMREMRERIEEFEEDIDDAAARLRGYASGIESAAEEVWLKVYRAERAAKQARR